MFRRNLDIIKDKILAESNSKKTVDTPPVTNQTEGTEKLEELKVKYEAEIKELKQEITSLKQRITNLEKLNEKLLLANQDSGGNDSTDVHNFYQEVFITGLQKELREKEEEISDIKMQALEYSRTVDKLQNKNMQNLKVIKMYRDMVNQKSTHKDQGKKEF